MASSSTRIMIFIGRVAITLFLFASTCGIFIVPVLGRRGGLRKSNQNEIRTPVRMRPKIRKIKKQQKRPNIIFILADDLGWNDVGYHGSDVETPVIDALSKEGVRLENYYTQAVCSPTRASLLTGRYQSRTGIDRVLDADEKGCLPLHLTTVAERLKVYGYSNHLVGKWHLGFSRPECLPTRRGFDTSLGPYTGYVDHFTRMKVAIGDNTTYSGYDFHKNEEPSYLYPDKYSTHAYAQESEKIIKKHSKTIKQKPLFLFLSLQAPHTPNQAPSFYMKYYNKVITDPMRRSHAAMTTCVDTAVGRIEEALKKYKMWRNSVLIFSSDNGGAVAHGADNSPFRGYKKTYLEGGIRVPAFVTSPLLPLAVRGTVHRGLIGAVDWFPTMIAGLAGGSTKYLALDGYNVWDNIRTGIPYDQRREYLFSVGGDCDWHPGTDVEGVPMYGTIRVGSWKLILGHIIQKPQKMLDNHKGTKSNGMRLYNLAVDPREYKNLYATHHYVVLTLLERLRYHCRARLPYIPLEKSGLADPQLQGGVFRPWLHLDN